MTWACYIFDFRQVKFPSFITGAVILFAKLISKILKCYTDKLSDYFFSNVSTNVFLIVAFVMFLLFRHFLENTHSRREIWSAVLAWMCWQFLRAKFRHVKDKWSFFNVLCVSNEFPEKWIIWSRFSNVQEQGLFVFVHTVGIFKIDMFRLFLFGWTLFLSASHYLRWRKQRKIFNWMINDTNNNAIL